MSEQSHTQQGEVDVETWAEVVWEHGFFGQRNTLLTSKASPWATGRPRTPLNPTHLLLLAKVKQVASIRSSKITLTLGNNRLSHWRWVSSMLDASATGNLEPDQWLVGINICMIANCKLKLFEQKDTLCVTLQFARALWSMNVPSRDRK